MVIKISDNSLSFEIVINKKINEIEFRENGEMYFSCELTEFMDALLISKQLEVDDDIEIDEIKIRKDKIEYIDVDKVSITYKNKTIELTNVEINKFFELYNCNLDKIELIGESIANALGVTDYNIKKEPYSMHTEVMHADSRY